MFFKNASILFMVFIFSFFCFATEEVAVISDTGTLQAIGVFLTLFMQTFGSAISVLLVFLVYKLFKKYGLDYTGSVDYLARTAVSRACSWVEVWAAKQSSKPTSEEKYKKAVEKAFEIAEKLGILDYIKKHVDTLIESHLFEYEELTLVKKN
ncbi:hypothetical protein M0R19_08175 [Candidatus Pacearchaeota archaeon]|jgi:hypothetical protein|nr:hypothetical protein [bacterium]MCK9597134.1 hypothetical protein [Candidatus Pacearchaeota archaeon]